MKLTKNQINYLRCHADLIIECLPEESPIRGNVLASGDEIEDRMAENNVISQLNSGNEWAWCTIKVTSRWKGYEGVDYLGQCSYRSKEDFLNANDYFPDMVARSLDDLVQTIESDWEKILSIGEIAS